MNKIFYINKLIYIYTMIGMQYNGQLCQRLDYRIKTRGEINWLVLKETIR